MEKLSKQRYSPRGMPIMERIFNSIDFSSVNDCWEWNMAQNNKGYGSIRWNHQTKVAHRAVYELLVGDIPEGLTLDHLCLNKKCVNPNHLEPVANRENNARGNSRSAVNARKTHCLNGHEYNKLNTYINRSGGRWCKTCRNDYMRSYNRRKGIVKGEYNA